MKSRRREFTTATASGKVGQARCNCADPTARQNDIRALTLIFTLINLVNTGILAP